MNQAQKSAVQDLPHSDEEYAVLQSICHNTVNEHVKNSVAGTWLNYKKVLVKVSQPCRKMLVACEYGHVKVDCMKIFSSILTDNGLCCKLHF